MEPSRGRVPERDSLAQMHARALVAAGGAALLAAVLMPAPARAQSVLGTIRGSLLDDQGDPMPGAPIRIVDEATGIQRETQTSARGDYEVPNLRAGSYLVEDASPGFPVFRRTGVVLSAGDTMRVDLRLSQVVLGAEGAGESRQPAAVRAEELVITAEGSSNIQLESPAIQVGLDQQQLSTLPRNSRDFQDYLFLTPNVVGAGESFGRYLSGQSSGAYLLLDGQPSNSVLTGLPTRSGAGIYAVDEIKVLSNSYGAEFGGLAAVVVTTRRGGSRLSGGAFYDFNADELNALTYAEKRGNLKRGFEGSDTQDHRYAAWLGGPIRKEKTFFFLNYEGFNGSVVGGGRVASVPTEKMRRGDFSELLPTRLIIDPDTQLPFPGNVIPAERLDATAQGILERFYPLPNRPTPNDPWRYQEFVNLQSNNNRLDVRLDHEFSASDSVFARFTWQDQNPGHFFLQPLLPKLGTRSSKGKARTLATSWMRIFSSRLLNELRGGWTLRASTRRTQFVVGEVADELGIEVPASARPLAGFPSFVFVDPIADIPEIPDVSTAGGNREESSLSFSDTLTWLLGRHSLKLGGLYSRNRIEDQFPLGLTGLTGRFVFTRDNAGSTGNALADLLLGRPFQSIEGIGKRADQPLDATSQLFAGFFQDDWKVSKRLTLFMGLRYEIDQGFRERRNLLANLDPEGRRVVVPDASITPLVIDTALPVVTAGEIGLDRALVNPDTDNLSPRLGFAYRLDEDTTVLRGGAGLFYPAWTAAGTRELLSRTAFQTTIIRRRPTLRQAFSTGTVDAPASPVVHAIPFDLERPEFLQYHVTLERELPGDFGIRVSFLGAHAKKLLINRLINTLPASTVRFDPIRNPADRPRLPFPTLAPTIRKLENKGSGDFKALQVETARRWRAGFGMHLAYTLSRTQTDAPDFASSTLGVVQYDPNDLSKNLGPDPYIPRHRFVLDATWDVPVGRGRSVHSLPGWLDALFGGWTVSTIVQARSGVYLTPFYTGDFARANIGTVLTNNGLVEAWRPDLVGDPSGSRDRDNFFNLAAFRLPAAGTIGNAPSGVIEGPGGWVVNLGVYKEIVSIHPFVLQLRVTLDNAFNHPQFFVDPASRDRFVTLTPYLVGGLPVTTSNGTTNVLGRVGVGNPDGFAVGRVIRVGLHVRF